jgi:serine/threonine-protein kinase RsbT
MKQMSASTPGELQIKTESDIVSARRTIREAAATLGFGETDVTRIVTASSEVARNVFEYAREGVMRWRTLESDGLQGLEVEFEDHGPGIKDVSLALQEGYSTAGGLGMGLPGARRLMDEFQIQSAVGRGTTITLKKWRKS